MKAMKPDGTGRGYFVTAAYNSHQLAFALIGPAGAAVVQPKTLISVDTTTDHVNVHLAPYGQNYLLLSRSRPSRLADLEH